MKIRKLYMIIAWLLCAFSAQAQGVVSGTFTINKLGQTVQFATGNLQLNAATFTWTVEDGTDTYVGSENVIGGAPANQLDLFGWSGKAYPLWGVSALDCAEVYGGEFLDWGANLGQDWTALNADEWTFLLTGRENAAALCARITVNGVSGLAILKDQSTQTIQSSYTQAAWNQVAADGAVFLPMAGVRQGGASVDMTQGAYWTKTTDGTTKAKAVVLTSDSVEVQSMLRARGCAVRLVKKSAMQTVTATPPDNCQEFDKWSDGVTDNPRTFEGDIPVDLEPLFKDKIYTIRTEATTGGSATIMK